MKQVLLCRAPKPSLELLLFITGVCYCLANEQTKNGKLHRGGMEFSSDTSHTGPGAALPHCHAIQLGAERGHTAIVSRGYEKRRSSLPGSSPGGGRHSGTTRLSAAARQPGITGQTRSRDLRFSETRTVGCDRSVTRSRVAWPPSRFSHAETIG